jgi:hypothetical protein
MNYALVHLQLETIKNELRNQEVKSCEMCQLCLLR